MKPEKEWLKGEKKSDEKETDLERINAREPVCVKQCRKEGTRTKSHHRALFSSYFFFARSWNCSHHGETPTSWPIHGHFIPRLRANGTDGGKVKRRKNYAERRQGEKSRFA